MSETVTMPKLGFDMAEGTLVRWVIAEGQPVIKGAVLAEIETDKATVEVESNFAGILRRHLVEEKSVVPVGVAIAIIAEADEKIEEAPSTATPAAGSPSQATPAGAPVAAVAAGIPETPSTAPVEVGLPAGVRVSPVARHLADQKGLDLRAIKGSGPLGRIVKKDVEGYLQQLSAIRPAMPVAPKVATPGIAPIAAPAGLPGDKKGLAPLTGFAPLGAPFADEILPLPRLRAAIGRRMVEAKQSVPHFYVTHEYKMAPVMDLRKQVNAMLSEEEKLSVNDFIVKAVALTLRSFPNLNASLDGDKIVHHGPVNVGVAVAIEGGLMTVVARDADRKPLRQIAAELRVVVARAREGKVHPEDIEGSTFSISNLGMFDVEHFIAIINPPEAAILAVGSAHEVPVVENGEIKPGLRMKATISVDHRVSDGVEAARFLQALALYLEEPLRLLV